MSVLDELRQALIAGFGPDIKHPVLTKARCRKILDAFEAAHPGLCDDTVRCCNCGVPIDSCAEETWWLPDALDEEEVGDDWVFFDHLFLCADCAPLATG